MKPSCCPGCGRVLLRHIRTGNLSWFCTTCKFEMSGELASKTLLRKSLNNQLSASDRKAQEASVIAS